MTPRPASLDDRGVAPVVGKALEIGIGVMVVALLTSTLYGSVVPGYRTAAGAELADRALARAAANAESVVPPPGVVVHASTRVSLPSTIRGSTYEIHATGARLELRHPRAGIGDTITLAVPERVVAVRGTWRSTDPFVVAASGNESGVTLTIGGGG